MANEKPVKENKETPKKVIINFLRNYHYLMNKKTEVAIGPKYVFLARRVPQVKL